MHSVVRTVMAGQCGGDTVVPASARRRPLSDPPTSARLRDRAEAASRRAWRFPHRQMRPTAVSGARPLGSRPAISRPSEADMGRKEWGTWALSYKPPDYEVDENGKIVDYTNDVEPNNWGRWGELDERGTANFITPDKIKA